MDEISQSLLNAEKALSRGDNDVALASLVEVREYGVTTRGLEIAIHRLREDEDVESVVSWIAEVRARLEAGEENPFQGLKHGGSEPQGAEKSSGLIEIEDELLGGLDAALQDQNAANAGFALVTNSEAESEGLSPGSLPQMDEANDTGDRPGPLSQEQKTKLKSSLAERLRSKARGFEKKLTTKKAKAVSHKESDAADPSDAAAEPREVVSNQGAVDDFFADLADDDELLDDVDSEADSQAEVESLVPDDSSEFEDPFADLDEESNVRDLTPMGSVEAVSRDESTAVGSDSESESSEPTGTDPANPFADLMYLEDDEPEEKPESRDSRPGYDTGVSQVRYRGVEPPPPTHRLKGANQVSHEDSDAFLLEPPEEDDVDFDLGFTNPESKPPESPFGDVSVTKPESEPEENDFDFDLGLNEPKAERVGGDAIETKPGESKADPHVKETDPGLDSASRGDASRTKPRGHQSASRDPQPTPLQLASEESEPIDEDEFFALAESFATESSAAEQTPYRGEPVVKDRPSRSEFSTPMPEPDEERENPFAHEAPTGVKHAAVESSFVLEEVKDGDEPKNSAASSQIVTNMSGVLLEARRMYESGEFVEALALCQKIMSRGENSEAEELVKTIEGEMERATIDEIGSLSRTPSLAVQMSDLAGMDLDHRAGFLISQIDGVMTFEDILELSGMSRLETMEVLADLLRQDVIEID